jgi:hypothetical protein
LDQVGQKANECERLAATTSDPNKRRASHVDMAKRGHTEAMGRVVADMCKPQ